MERTPVKTIPIHEHLRPRLCDTYENDSIFDKFEVVFSGDAKNVMTGSYNNNFMIYPSDPEKDTEVVLQADKSAFKAKKVGIPTPMNSSTSPTGSNTSKKGGSRAGSPAAGAVGQGQRMRKETDADQIDFNKKILHMSWHPFEDSIAIAATNNVSHSPQVFVYNPNLTRSSCLSFLHCKGSSIANIAQRHLHGSMSLLVSWPFRARRLLL
jgi:serine/threonine-protein phosphatase 2A regulatory subunit B